MDTLSRSLVEKAGYDYGFEYTVSQNEGALVLGSARFDLEVQISTLYSKGFAANLINATAQLIDELNRHFISEDACYRFDSISLLATFFQRASSLAVSLPNKAEDDYCKALSDELRKYPDEIKNTDVERIIKQRVGQTIYRNAMRKYWDGACAVTGTSLSSVLKASHALPWAECQSDRERMDIYNGFLLTANLDALFDRFLISFSPAGEIIISNVISLKDRDQLGLTDSLSLRWITELHEKYLAYHRSRLLLL